MKKINISADGNINEVLEYYRKYPKPEIPLREIEKNLLEPLGFDKLVPKRGSIYTAHHKMLEDYGQFAGTGNLTFHIIHRKKQLLIYRQHFKQIIVPVLKTMIERKLEE